ncbi:S-layer homology domain-containing protein [Cohnella abietis]|uniref:SLH domain-containing protein n=1 Tax=Cohnella abietis TaxID=2507935 RepID=A0A3T1DBQ2_9BACL|nr:S-layer homology domain-containing protein [Cohnella abietis]BBI35530.1 hypothetical protein KCTCHS21_49290 [Cohnella abietis]
MRKLGRKVTAVLLAIMLLLSTTQQIGIFGEHKASAANSDFAGGTGAQGDPYQISTAGQLNAVRNYLGADIYFKLINDIDLSSYKTNDSGKGWEPIGTTPSDPVQFKGVFDGAGYKISNLYINRPQSHYQALFAYTNYSTTIKNIKLIGVNVNGGQNSGSLVGQNNGTVSFASASGEVSGTYFVGGLIGRNYGGSTVNINSNVNVIGTMYVGGLIGYSDAGINKSYAIGDVSGSSEIGGLVGHNSSSIQNSFALGNVTGTDKIGGLIGNNQGPVSNSYASGKVTGVTNTGGLIGVVTYDQTMSNVFYNKETTGQSDSGKGMPKLTAEMQLKATYMNWTFDANVWTIDPSHNNGYPYLSELLSPEHVIYSGNGNTSGTPPISKLYPKGQVISVAGNTGSLVKTGSTFVGWTTKADGSGFRYQPGQLFPVDADTTFYAHWLLTPPVLTADTTDNDIVSPIEITFNDDSTWSDAIIEISYDGEELDEDDYSIDEGKITIEANVLSAGTYTIAVAAEGYADATVVQTITPSTSLNSLILSNGPLNETFTAKVTSYTQNVDYAVTSLTVTPTVADPSAIVEVAVNDADSEIVNSGEVSAALPLKVGDNTITITVTAEDDEDEFTKTYTIIVTRKAASLDLSHLVLNSGGLNKTFTPSETSYTQSVENAVANLTVTPTAVEPTAVVKVAVNDADSEIVTSGEASAALPLKVGDNTITITVTVGNEPSKVYTIVVNRKAAPTNTDSNGPIPNSNKDVTSTNGKITIPTDNTGKVSLDNEVTVEIPVNAANKDLTITIDKVLETNKLLANNEILASKVFEILKNVPENFSKLVTLTFVFDTTKVGTNQRPVVFYYDEVNKKWIEIANGKVSGNRITVSVNHFTKFAVLAVDQNVDQSVDQPVDIPTVDVKFSDIAGHWAEASVNQAVYGGIVKGYADGTFKPNATVTRAEFSVMLMNALKPQEAGAELTFTDSAKIGAWAQKSVAQAVQTGIIKGYTDGTFRPNTFVTRTEMAVMIANALKLSIESDVATSFADDKAIPVWAKGSVEALKKLGIVKGTGNKFNPSAQATRAEVVIILLNMLEQSK